MSDLYLNMSCISIHGPFYKHGNKGLVWEKTFKNNEPLSRIEAIGIIVVLLFTCHDSKFWE